MRLHKWIALNSRLSRRKAEEAILEGRVKVNGLIVHTLGVTINVEQDSVHLDDYLIQKRENSKTILFYKPREVITSKKDENGRKTVMDFFPDDLDLNPVGRLDYESEGLLILTHDGDLALKLTHPRYEIPKIYEAWIMPVISTNPHLSADLSADHIQLLLNGLELSDGFGHFDQIQALGKSHYQVTVSEGRNRFIRRMFDAIGYTVTRLLRIQQGPFLLKDLKPGCYVTADESLVNQIKLTEVKVAREKKS